MGRSLPFGKFAPILGLIVFMAAAGVVANSAQAQLTASWSATTTSGTWSTASNWTGGVIPGTGTPAGFPVGSGDTANILVAPTNNATITLNAPETIGYLNIGNSSFTYTLSGSSALTFDNTVNSADAQLNANGNKGNTISVNLALASSLDVSNTSSSALTLSGTSITATTGVNLNFHANTGQAITVSDAIGVSGGTIAIYNLGTSTGKTTLSGALWSKVASITENSAGSILAITASNANYGGPTTLTAGEISLGNATALGGNGSNSGTGGAFTISSGGTLDSSAANLILTTVNPENWNGNFTFIGTQNLNVGTGAVTMGNNCQVTVNANTLTVGGNISGSSYSLTKAGAGSLVLNGANNTYSGPTTISGGTLQFSNSGALGLSPSVAVNGTSTLAINYGGASDFTQSQVGSLLGITTFNTPTTALAFDTTNASSGATYSAALSLPIGFTKLGPNTLILTAANTYTGPTIISAGTLQLGNGTNDGSLPGASSITDNGLLLYNLINPQTVGNFIGGSGSLTLNAGLLTLSNTNAFIGLTTVNSGGTLNLTSNLALQQSALNTSGAGTVVLSGITTPTFGGLTGGTNLTAISGYAGSVTALTLDQQNGTSSYNGVISDAVTGMTLTKAGTGTQVLTGANTYTGTTYVNAGVLTLQFNSGNSASGVISSSSPVVMADGTLNVSGASTAIANVQTFNGATFNGGFSTITLAKNTATSVALNLGTLTRNPAAYINFTSSASTTPVSLSYPLDVSGVLLGPWATVGSGTSLAYAGLSSPTGGTISLYTGATVDSTGALSSVSSPTTNYTYSAAATLTGPQTGNTLRYTGAGTTTALGNNTLTLNGLMNAGTAKLTITANDGVGAGLITGANGELDIVANTQSITIAAPISGTGAVVYGGLSAGTFTSSDSTSTYTGKTSVLNGILGFAFPLSLTGVAGPLGAPTTTANATIDLYPGTSFYYNGNSTVTSVTNRTINLAGNGSGVVKVNGVSSTNDCQFYYNGPTTATGTGPRTLQIEANGDRAVVGWGGSIPNMSDGSPVSLALVWGNGSTVADGIINFTGTNTFTGPITLTGGGDSTLNPGIFMIGGTGSYMVSNNTPILVSGGSGVLGNGNYGGNMTFATTLDPVEVYYASSANQTFSGVISGPGVLIMAGTGATLTLTGADTYSLGTSIAGGTLQIGNGGTGEYLASPTISNSAALVFDHGDSLTYSGAIGGSGSLTKLGTGTLTLAGSNSYTGATTVSSGAISAGSIFVSSGSSSLGNASTPVVLGGPAASGALNYTGGATSYTRGLTINAGGGQLSNAGGSLLTVSGSAGISAGGLFTAGGSSNITISSFIAGVGGVTEAGGNTLTLTGPNTYSGVTTISSGTLSAGSIVVNSGSSSLGNASTAVVLGSAGSQGTLLYTGPSASYTRGFTVNAGGGQLTNTGGGTLTVSSGGISAAGPLTLAGASGNNISISSAISGAGGLTLAGANNVTLSSPSNSYSGPTTISGGRFVLAGGGILGDTAITINPGGVFQPAIGSTAGISNGATLNLNGGLFDMASDGGAGAFTLYEPGGFSSPALSLGSGTLDMNLVNTGGTTAVDTLVVSAGSASLTGAIDIALSKSSTGTLTPGTYPIIQLGGGAFNLAGGSFTLDNTGGTSEVYPLGSTSYNLSLKNSGTAESLVIAQLAVSSGTWQGNGGSLSGSWTNSANWVGNLVPAGSGAEIFAVTTSGATSITLGGAQSTSSLTFGNGSTASTYSIDPGNGGTLSFYGLSGGNTAYVSVLSGSHAITAPVFLGANLSIDAAANSLFTVSGNIVENSPGMSLILSNLNSGTVVLAGSNSYTGGTTIGGGVLSLANSAALGTTGTINLAGGILQFTASDTTDYSSRFSTAAGQAYNFDTDGQAVTLAGNLTSSGGDLTKLGLGSLTLSGSNTYNGGTTVSAGTLTAATSSALGTGTVTLSPSSGSAAVLALTSASPSISTLSSSGAGTSSLMLGNPAAPSATALTLGSGNGNVNFSGAISNASPTATGSLIIAAGNGTVALSGSNSYSGGTALDTGTLQIGSNSALGSGTLAINGGTLGNASGGAVTLTTNNPQIWNANIAFDGPNDLNLGTGAVTLSLSPTITVTSNSLTVGGNIAGTGFSLTKAGLGNLVLGGANTYNSGTLVLAGTLTATSDTALGTGPVTLSPGAGTAVLALTSGSPSINMLTTSGASSVVLGNVANSTSTALTLGATGGNMTLSTVFSDQSAGNALAIGGLIKAGSGILTLNGASTYTGPTAVSAGTLSVASIVPSGGASNIGNSTIVLGAAGSQGTLYYTGSSASYSNGFTINTGGGQFFNAGSGQVTVQTGAINAGGTLTVDAANNTISISSSITGTGGLVKTGANTLTLSSTASSYTGPTSVLAGSLGFGAALTLAGVPGPLGAPTGANATIDIYPGAAFYYTGSGQPGYSGAPASVTNRTINLAGNGSGVVKVNGIIFNNDSQFYYDGPTTATGTGPRTLQIEANGDRAVVGWGGGIPNMSDGSQVSLALVWGNGQTVANGIIDLTGVNTFTGPITLTGGGQGGNLNAGIFMIGGSGSYPPSNNTPVLVSGGSGVLGSGNYPGNITFTASTADPVQLYYASSANQILSGVISGPGLLVMAGSGSTLTLTGSNTYTGATTVSSGTLQIGNNTSGENLSSGTVSVSNGAGLVFSPGDAMTYGGTISGSGSVTMAGTGMLSLSGNNTNSGPVRVQSGVLQVALYAYTALGAGSVTVNGGTLDLAGNVSVNVPKFSGAGGVVSNSGPGGFADSVLTVNQSVATTFSGAFEDGASPVGLNLQGGTLTLMGNNTNSGQTNVNFSSALIAGAPNVLSGSSAVYMYGSVLDVTAGAQNVGALSLDGGSALKLSIGNVLTSLGSVYFNGTLNITGATGALIPLIAYPNQTYNPYDGTFTTVDLNGNPLPAAFSLVYNNNVLDLVGPSSGSATWNIATGGSWTVGSNWSGGSSPNGLGAVAILGSATTSPTTISLDSPQTVGSLTFANSAGYTLTSGSAGSLTLDNTGGAGSAQIVVLAGSHTIAAPVIISNGPAYVSIINSGSLDISGDISEANGSHSLSLSSSDGTGLLSLDGSNSFTGGVYVNSGTLLLNGAASLAPGSALEIGTTVPPSVPSVLSSPAAAPSVSLAPVPEPGSLTLLIVCAAAMGFGLWRRRTKEINVQ